MRIETRGGIKEGEKRESRRGRIERRGEKKERGGEEGRRERGRGGEERERERRERKERGRERRGGKEERERERRGGRGAHLRVSCTSSPATTAMVVGREAAHVSVSSHQYQTPPPVEGHTGERGGRRRKRKEGGG